MNRRSAAARLLPIVIATCLGAGSVAAQVVPPDFELEVVFSGLSAPTNIEFASDGRVFVAEKSGIIRVFDDLDDTSPTVFANLSANVMDYWDRGLLGLALHPDFPAVPHVFVLYTMDTAVGGSPPDFGDACADPTGAGCVVGGRLSRLTAAGSVMTGPEEVLLEAWCQQYPSHSIGDLAFGLDGMLYLSCGDGASFNFVDWGQAGNPCGDPSLQGGALRSQDLRTTGDAVGWNGSVLRLDPATGAAPPTNPLAGGATSGDDPVIAYGLRNPYRFTVHPTTGEIWLGDVGWGLWEEIDRIADPADAVVENFGWPCYEGAGVQGAYDGENLPICETLYAQPGAHQPPHYAYHHGAAMPGTCGIGTSAVSGLAFHVGGPYPSEYDGALFFGDYNRGCIWVMFEGAGGLPDPAQVASFVSSAGGPVDLARGPTGELFYVDFNSGSVRRVISTAPPEFLRGDANGDGTIDIGDPVATLAALFQGGPNPCADAQDANDDGAGDISDPVYLLAFLFSGGASPPPPYGPSLAGCGADPTPDSAGDLGCGSSGACP